MGGDEAADANRGWRGELGPGDNALPSAEVMFTDGLLCEDEIDDIERRPGSIHQDEKNKERMENLGIEMDDRRERKME